MGFQVSSPNIDLLKNTVAHSIMFFVKTTSVFSCRWKRNVFYGKPAKLAHTIMLRGKDGLSATLAFINTRIKTLNPKMPTAQAVAMTKNRIAKVGTNQEIEALIGEDTVVMDLDGKTVLPGLIDTHIHVADYGRCLMWLDLTDAKSVAELQDLLRDKAAKTLKDKWIIGQGWNETRFKEAQMPTIQDLDEVIPDNPVILYREATMICIANSKALELVGVTENTPVPKGGAIDKDPQTGKLTGILRDTATTLVWQAVPEPTGAELLEATAYACQKIAAAGVTSVVWVVISESELPLIQTLHAQGRLPFRVNVVVPEAILENAACLKRADSLVLRVGGAFIVVDGYLDSKEAALIEPYSDDTSNIGKMYLSEESLAASVKKAISAGVQPVIHAMGDKAIDLTLKVIEQNSKSTRFRIEQAAVLNKSLIERLKGQNVVVSVQPRVISTEFSVWSAQKRLGGRAKWLHPLKTLLEAGVGVAGGSDCPMEPLSALLGMQEVMLRPSNPEQRLSFEEALCIYTLDAAYCSCEEAEKGSIEEGKLADLTVLASDPSGVESDKIKDIAVDFVVVNGKILVAIT